MIPVVVVVVGVETTFKPMYGFGTIRRKNIFTYNVPMYALLQLNSITEKLLYPHMGEQRSILNPDGGW